MSQAESKRIITDPRAGSAAVAAVATGRPVVEGARANLRQALDQAIAGGLGGLFGLYCYVELVHAESVYARDALAGLLIGGSLGVFLNGLAPFRDGAWRRVARGVAWGAAAAALGGAIGLVMGELVIAAFKGGVIGRALSWSVLGLGIGVAQGLADRSRERLKFGLIGGAIGGFVGGFLFELARVVMGNRLALGQALGVVVMGGGLGLFPALVEQALRKAWVQVMSGRQEGRMFLLRRGANRMGLDEQAEIGLFGDSAVTRGHAEIHVDADGYTLRALAGSTRLNGDEVIGRRDLKDGDRLELGRTRLVFRCR